jgi:TIR domain
MPKTSYERLDRSTGWFDADICSHRFEGVNKAGHGGFWIEVIYRTQEGVWINSQWSFEGPWRHTSHRFSFWQVTLDQAAEWFPRNYQDAPKILIEDFEREPNRKNPSHPPTQGKPSEAPVPIVTPDPHGVSATPNRIPSAEELISIAAALQNLLNTFEQYKLFLDDPSNPIGNGVPTVAMLVTDSVCRTEVQGSFCRLEKLLNPRRLPYGSPELTRMVVSGWPPQVMVGLSTLKQHVDQLIQRWDIPEVCEDRTIRRGRYDITRDDGTIEKIDRPVQPCALTTAERDKMGWVLNTFVEVLGKTIEASGPAAIPEGENKLPAAPALTIASPPRSDTTTDRIPQPRSDERQNMVRDQVFISYSHKDQRFLNELLTHLKPYLRKGTFTAWSDKQIKPGSQWFDEIKAALAKTSVAVMLVSPDFLDSDFIHEHELGPLLKEAEAGGVTILWVLIRDCSYEETLLEPYQAIMSPDKSLASMPRAKRDTAWKAVCKAIKEAVNRP